MNYTCQNELQVIKIYISLIYVHIFIISPTVFILIFFLTTYIFISLTLNSSNSGILYNFSYILENILISFNLMFEVYDILI